LACRRFAEPHASRPASRTRICGRRWATEFSTPQPAYVFPHLAEGPHAGKPFLAISTVVLLTLAICRRENKPHASIRINNPPKPIHNFLRTDKLLNHFIAFLFRGG
jgi:hypothetical protein